MSFLSSNQYLNIEILFSNYTSIWSIYKYKINLSLNKLSYFKCDDYDLKNAITGVALKSESGIVNDLLRSKPVEKPEDYSFTKLYEHKTLKSLGNVNKIIVPKEARITVVGDIHGQIDDILLILDEVMCGMGRTGSLFACEDEEIIPDILDECIDQIVDEQKE